MTIQKTTSQSPKAQVTAMFGLVSLLLCADPLDEAAAQFSHLICALTCELLKFAPSIIILAGGHALGSYILAHQQLFLSVQTLLSLRQLLLVVCGAA
jgi:hypothetical protein